MSERYVPPETNSASVLPPLSKVGKVSLAALVVLLFVSTFVRPIFKDENFVFRDAGHFYYPYFQIQIDQWRDGKVPAWNPYENGGEPLAGNPTASVFYPGKLIFVFDYATAYKWYLMGHLALAALTCFASARGFSVSYAGAVLAAVSYSFSGFIFFQIYNIVFLIGAAWLPIGVLAVDRVVRTPSMGWSLLLAVVLALQVLGGDPQAAELTGIFALGYLAFFHLGAARGFLAVGAMGGLGASMVHILSPLMTATRVAWGHFQDGWEQGGVAADIVAYFQHTLEVPGSQTGELRISAVVGVLLSGIAGLAGLFVFWRNRHWLRDRTIRHSIRYLILAGVLAFGLSAVQVLPTLEFASRTSRASPDVPEETAAFSLHPARLLEFVFPAAYGRLLPENTRWFPFLASERSVWTPTIYFGLAPLILSLLAMRMRKGSASARWLTWLAILSLWMALGKFGGLAWVWDSERLGAADPLAGMRQHGSNDGLYWLLENTIPGFAQFRYPSKLLVFTTLALSILGGAGLDQVLRQDRWRIVRRAGFALLSTSLLASILILATRSRLITVLDSPKHGSNTFGPFNAEAAWWHLLESSLHTGVVVLALFLSIAFGLAFAFRAKSAIAVLVVAVTCLDLGLAHRWLVLTDTQSEIDAKPVVLAEIEQDAVEQGIIEPYRIYRTRLFEPRSFRSDSSLDRVRESTRWERATAQAKYAIAWGGSYAKTEGTMTLFDMEFFFAPWTVATPADRKLRGLAERRPDVMVYFPKNGLDMWNARYFILPSSLVIDNEERGFFTLLFDRSGEPLPVVSGSPPAKNDYQVLRNPEAFPRAWIVHDVEILPPIRDMRKAIRGQRLERLLYRSSDGGLPLWQGQPHGDYPLLKQAMVEASSGELKEIEEVLSPPTPIEPADRSGPLSAVNFEAYESDFVRLRVSSKRGGLLVLADSFFPGWRATVDGSPVTIFRTNQAMRGVLMESGEHIVEFRYDSPTLRWGAILSITSIGVVMAFVIVAVLWRWRRRQK